MKRNEIEAVFHRYGPLVYRRALRILGHPLDAEEAVNEVFIRALKSADTFEKKCEISVWLCRITTNYCLNRIRDKRRRDELFQEKSAYCKGGVSEKNMENFIAVRRLLSSADQMQGLAACYVIIDGMSHTEAAAFMGVSRRTVGNLVDRFITWGRAHLKDEEVGC